MDTKELTALTQGIATALGAEWEVELNDDNWSRRINHKLSPKRLYVSGDGYTKPTKVSIGGHMHVGENGQYVQVYETAKDGSGWHKAEVPTIGVSIARGFDTIAAEIKRRLLPEYDRIMTLALAQVQAEADHKATKRANLQRMADAAGHVLPAEDERYQRRDSSFYVSFDQLRLEVKANQSDVDIKIDNLTPAQAERLLQFIREERLQ
jgi:hypothetical protein